MRAWDPITKLRASEHILGYKLLLESINIIDYKYASKCTSLLNCTAPAPAFVTATIGVSIYELLINIFIHIKLPFPQAVAVFFPL